MLAIKVLTIFPELFPGPLSASVLGRAMRNKLWSLKIINIRDFAIDKRVDDAPIGGGNGMVMRPDVVGNAIKYATKGKSRTEIPVFYLSPRGKLLTQNKLHELAKLKAFVLLCGRFEGVDQRVLDHYKIQEISVGNYVLTGGEIAAYALVDGCVRLLPGVLNNKDSSYEESFAVGTEYQDLIEYPQYTKPNSWKDLNAPEILFTGNHKKIAGWRLERAKALTKKLRPDLSK